MNAPLKIDNMTQLLLKKIYIGFTLNEFLKNISPLLNINKSNNVKKTKYYFPFTTSVTNLSMDFTVVLST